MTYAWAADTVGEQWKEKRIYIKKKKCVTRAQNEFCGHSRLTQEKANKAQKALKPGNP